MVDNLPYSNFVLKGSYPYFVLFFLQKNRIIDGLLKNTN